MSVFDKVVLSDAATSTANAMAEIDAAITALDPVDGTDAIGRAMCDALSSLRDALRELEKRGAVADAA